MSMKLTGMRFCFAHTVPVRREQVFAFFEDPSRLEVLHSGWSRIRLLHHHNQVQVGNETWVEAMIAGFIPVVLGFRHTLFDPPLRFGEESIHGPFSRFIHIHEFIAGEGNTVVRDVLDVCLPWHYGGEAVMRRGMAPTIRRMFHKRAEALLRLIDDGSLTRLV